MSACDRVSDVSHRCAGMKPVVICMYVYMCIVFIRVRSYIPMDSPATHQKQGKHEHRQGLHEHYLASLFDYGISGTVNGLGTVLYRRAPS